MNGNLLHIVRSSTRWFRSQGRWWGTSLLIHSTLMTCLAFLLGAIHRPVVLLSAPAFETTIDSAPTVTTTLDLDDTGGLLIGGGDDPDQAAAGLPPPGDDSDLVEWGDVGGTLHRVDPPRSTGVAAAASGDGPVAASSVEAAADLRYFGFSTAGLRSKSFNAGVVGSLAGRGRGARGGWLKRGGGTAQSEDAVARGLRWLAAHQWRDGGWRFDLTQGPCDGLCRDSGSEPSTTAATALALLAFLGHGETSAEDPYQENVKRGLFYLTSRMRDSSLGGDFREGTMYGQGLAAMALAEAYALTGDQSLAAYAQKAVDFIVSAQDPRGGGWRYEPQMPGDTTVTGWQLLALKSAQTAHLRVPPRTLYLATRFLDSVAYDRGARYTYLPQRGYYSSSRQNHLRDQTTTAVGLLCRIFTGWERDHPALQEGIEILSRAGPSRDDLYYNYYATQVMHHWGGNPWRAWNDQLRDYLVRTQATEGHESGSWNFLGGQAARGGRLYNTAMAAMTLEVYYRHLPLWDAADRPSESPTVGTAGESK